MGLERESGEGSLDYAHRLRAIERAGIVLPARKPGEGSLDYENRLRVSKKTGLV